MRKRTVYTAVSDRHLMVTDRTIRLTRGPKESRARPAIDVLFRSAAMSFGPCAIDVILSGMLDDGTAGAWAIKDQQGIVLVQDPAQALYPSMLESVLQHVKADFTETVEALGAEIARLCREPATRPGAPVASQRHELENGIAGEENALQGGVMEERVLLLRQMSNFAAGQRAADVAEQSLRQAEHIDQHIQTLREMVMDPDILGHSPA